MTPLDLVVAISMSQPEERRMAPRGVALEHLNHAYIELARQIFAAGGSIAYGGNPLAGEPNYVQILRALLLTYSNPDRPAADRIQVFLASPIWKAMAAADYAALMSLMKLHKLDITDPHGAPAEEFAAMRRTMLRETDARVVLGGKLERFTGVWPGIVEEAYLTARAGAPLYVIGGLGGAASLVADLVRGHATDPKLDLDDELRSVLREAEMHNGLTVEENEQLLRTADLDLIVALVLRGLESIAEQRRARPR